MGRGSSKLWLPCGSSPKAIAEDKSLNIPVKGRGRLIGDTNDGKWASRFVLSKPSEIELHRRGGRGAKPPNETSTEEQDGEKHGDDFSMREHIWPDEKLVEP